MGRSASSGGSSAGATALEISISLAGKDGPTRLWTLECPTGGTLPQSRRACSRLDRLDHPFAPVPANVACTEIYGGPQVAEVRGTYQGKPVNTRFTRSDGCEIARWNAVRFLFPAT
jgi:hypothetical protein